MTSGRTSALILPLILASAVIMQNSPRSCRSDLQFDIQRLPEMQAALEKDLQCCRTLAKNNPAVYQPEVAIVLHNLAILYRDMQKLQESQAANEEALRIRRKLAQGNPSVYRSAVAETLIDLGS